jgi:hypothetical protein
MKCSNGKYKYGEHGRCEFDTLAACKAAAAAIHAKPKPKKEQKTKDMAANGVSSVVAAQLPVK